MTETRPHPISFSSILFPSSASSLPTASSISNQSSQYVPNNGLNIFEPIQPSPNFYQPQIPIINPQTNIFENKDLYITLLKLRNYGFMESGSLAEKALILFEQNKK
jgi:hypothetical protein